MSVFAPDPFSSRHIGLTETDIKKMLDVLGLDSIDAILEAVVPATIRSSNPLNTPKALSEPASLARLREIANQNQVWRSYIGAGYHGTHTPAAILRNLLENPGWYTAYTPYQAEISQGRLEALLNFQTMVSDLTGFDCANASLLDEATAAAEAMTMSRRVLKKRKEAKTFFVDQGCNPQSIAVVQTRAEPLGYNVIVGDAATYDFSQETFGVLIQVPATDGTLLDPTDFITRAHEHGAIATVSVDPLAMMLIKSPAACGADIAIGSSQRFGVPMGYGGPHAAFMATDSKWVRNIPGRIIGVSQDMDGNPALRMALQTREQHIRRERATSNICTAQVLLAVIAGMYAVYHGPKGLTAIAERVRAGANALKQSLSEAGFTVGPDQVFDTIWVEPGEKRQQILVAANAKQINLRHLADGRLGIALDETTTPSDLADLFAVFGSKNTLNDLTVPALADHLRRTTTPLQHPVFHTYHSETALMRYLRKLQGKDLALDTAMIPLGSCTMKLNAAAEMIPITWPEFGAIHPFVPKSQAQGYTTLVNELEAWLAEITGFDHVTFQPNAGSQGEYTGLLLIRAWHKSRGEEQRNICLIPRSAHGTNPASAVMAGMKVVVVKCHDNGDIDIEDLTAKADEHADNLAAIMVTYPSTHGVFEETISELCQIVHDRGGQVYLDGANMNAMVGLCKPGKFGADVAHLNLHKTFAIPHGGGGPGVGPACIRAHLAPFLPNNPVVEVGGENSIGAISAAPYGSTGILPIPWAYIAMLGPDGLKAASAVAILSANYISKCLEDDFTTLFKGRSGFVAHECILDLNPLKIHGITAEDVAKRLMDYGFHAPTLSFPVVGTLMVEPTESEPMYEIERFIEAMKAIREEIRAIETGASDPTDNALKNAPHTAACTMGEWTHPYSRESAVFPTAHTRDSKYWPTVRRVDNVHGDKNLMCSCPDLSAYE